MPTPAKQKAVEELNNVFAKATSAVLANYQGISASGLAALRAHLKSRSLDFRVIKNTLAQRAAKDTRFRQDQAGKKPRDTLRFGGRQENFPG